MRRQEGEETELGNGERRGSSRAPGLHRPVLSEFGGLLGKDAEVRPVGQDLIDLRQGVRAPGASDSPTWTRASSSRVWTEIVGNPQVRIGRSRCRTLDASLLLVSRSQESRCRAPAR